VLSRGCGRRVTLAAGLAAMAGGYGGLWLAASGRAAPPYWALVGLTSAAFAGGSWVDTACVATNVRNFPGHRGTVVGAPAPSVPSVPSVPGREFGLVAHLLSEAQADWRCRHPAGPELQGRASSSACCTCRPSAA